MNDIIITVSGRDITSKDIEQIDWARKRYPGLSRSELAGTVCEIIGWNTPAGHAKIQQCKTLFDILESDGTMTFPPPKISRKRKTRVHIPKYKFDETPITGDLKEHEPIHLVIAQPGDELKRWRAYVDQYHMLGDKWVFGSRLQYFVKSKETELGCIQFSASAWSLKKRDELIGWTVDDRKKRLNLIINNSRYLIFPWVNIKNLASKALSLSVKRIQEDWLREYCYAPVMLETFVDIKFFKGTCYKASNWIHIGETAGTGRSRGEKENVSRKAIYIYPLQKDFKEVLRGEKACRMVEPE